MSQYIIIYSIGPVGKFITSARTTHDLFAGSKMLSKMCLRAILYFKNQGGQIIMPNENYDDPKKIDSIPNRFVGKIDVNTLETLQQLIDDLKAQSLVELENFKDELVKNTNSTLTNKIQQQFDNYFKVYCVAGQLGDKPYHEVYNNLEKEMVAVKQSQKFNQVTINGVIGEVGRKCNLDGENNVVLYRKTEKEDRTNQVSNKLFMNSNPPNEEVIVCNSADDKPYKIWEIKEGEGLSTISAIKRIYENEAHKQFSTTKICLMHLFDKLELNNEINNFIWRVEGSKDDNQKNLPKKYLRHSNDELYFEENINKKVFKTLGKFDTDDAAEAAAKVARQHYNDFISEIKKQKDEIKICKYYGLLASDGDNMGEWLSGALLSDKSDLEHFQSKLSAALIKYSKQNQALNSPDGKYIYAGGEDFLGFLNLKRAFIITNELNTRYKKETEAVFSNPTEKIKAGTKEFTISAGLLIAHYKEPLSDVVKQTLALEKRAKDAGRNKFAIQVLKRSGGDLICIYPWLTKDKEDVLPILLEVYNNVGKLFSNTFITQLAELHNSLDGILDKDFWKMEMERLIKRSYKPGSAINKVEEINKFITSLNKLWAIDNDVTNFLSMLNICDFMQRKTNNKNDENN